MSSFVVWSAVHVPTLECSDLSPFEGSHDPLRADVLHRLFSSLRPSLLELGGSLADHIDMPENRADGAAVSEMMAIVHCRLGQVDAGLRHATAEWFVQCFVASQSQRRKGRPLRRQTADPARLPGVGTVPPARGKRRGESDSDTDED